MVYFRPCFLNIFAANLALDSDYFRNSVKDVHGAPPLGVSFLVIDQFRGNTVG